MPASDITISVRGLSKVYAIQHNAGARRTFGEEVMDRLRQPFRRAQNDTFWALKDVSFDVKAGEVVGIIGRNGAGKSTLLKVLSRITEPTSGKIKLYGRVGSLLEVGTGFHPELTGRENIYLNGAILGMTRGEIRKQFDAIVDFAEVEKFLDTPVKRYSSGMYVRLAFAVAAHLEPEILIVDEVLAVGDAEFQGKCMGKMNEVSRGGRTVLFVSHNMQAIRKLCTCGIMLDRGQVAHIGEIESAINAYLRTASSRESRNWTINGTPSKALSICGIRAMLHGTQPEHTLKIEIELKSTSRHKPAFVAVDIADATGSTIMQAIPRESPFIESSPAQNFVLEISLPPLVPGHYTAGIWVGSHYSETLDSVDNCVAFEILQSPTVGRTVPHSPDHGWVVPPSRIRYLRATEPADGGGAEPVEAISGLPLHVERQRLQAMQ